ncbi:hypothetical protein [Streptomyces sp. NPDC048644]|uniref:hypothetical protein n=1 Tax=Streptomyces sp. NPDC048644 TaxID=3365582 RepID=UPI0037197B57
MVGYLLLDYSDIYGISEVGWYFARTQALITWPVEEFFMLLGAHAALPVLRAQLAALLSAAGRAAT